MAGLALQIVEPAHDAYLVAVDLVHLKGKVISGAATGLFFKWYSTLNIAATTSQPELNAAHGADKLDLDASLDVGSHVITLAAADQEHSDLDSIKAITRAAFAGGAPDPGNPTPCVVHRLRATLRAPVEGGTLSKASAIVEMRAPVRWSKEEPAGSHVFIPDTEYRSMHKIQYRFELGPTGAPDPTHTASVIVDLAAATFFRDGNTPYLRWQGALPAQLSTGGHVLTLFVEKPDRTVQHSASCHVSLIP